MPIGTSAFEFILYSRFSLSINDIIGVFTLTVSNASVDTDAPNLEPSNVNFVEILSVSDVADNVFVSNSSDWICIVVILYE